MSGFAVTFEGFHGANTFVDELMLSNSVCTSTIDQEPSGTGDLRPRKDVGPSVRTLTPVLQQKTIWRAGQNIKSDSDFWFSFTNRVDLARGFEPTETNERTYYTGDGAPKWTDSILALTGGAPYPQGWRLLGVPGPTAALAMAVNVAGTTGTEASTAFVYTFVNSLGWESAPSPPSNIMLVKPGTTFDLTNFESPQANYDINMVRLYKGVSDGAGGFDYYFFREWMLPGGQPAQPIGDTRSIGSDALTTEGWRPPPADGFGLKRMWGGILVMLSAKSVRFCEPYKHYAWPLKYEIGLTADPIAIGIWGQRGIVLTGADAVLFAGNDPAAMDDEPAKINRPCSSAASVVEFNEGAEQKGVAWASEKGLCWYGDGGFAVLTEKMLEPEQWQAMNPDTMVATQYKGRYLCFYTDGQGVRRGFCIDPGNLSGFYLLSKGYDAIYRDPKSDTVFVLDGKDVKKWAAGAGMKVTVKSKLFQLPEVCNLGELQVIASTYPVTVTMWVDGVQRYSRAIASSDPVKLPSGYMGERVKFQVESMGRVFSVKAATALDDL